MCAIEAIRHGYANDIATPHAGLAKALSASFNINAIYDPNKVDWIERPVGIKKLPGLHIGVFGTGLPWKNMDTQYLAAAMTPGVDTVHTQSYSLNPNHISPSHLDFLRSLSVKHEIHPYFDDRPEYFQVAAQMTVNLAVTFSEAFGYLGLESFMLGVPAIVGATTPAMRGADKILKRCVVNYIDDPAAISDAIMNVLSDYNSVVEAGLRYCKKLAGRG